MTDHREVDVFQRRPGDRQLGDLAAEPAGELGDHPRRGVGADALAAVGLTEKAGAKLRQLSGGQRRRVDVALGIVGSPELLFLDEPTTGFDPEARRQFWHLISGLAHSGTTILLTTHYLDEAEALASRVGVIAAGRIRAVDAPAELGGRASASASSR